MSTMPGSRFERMDSQSALQSQAASPVRSRGRAVRGRGMGKIRGFATRKSREPSGPCGGANGRHRSSLRLTNLYARVGVATEPGARSQRACPSEG